MTRATLTPACPQCGGPVEVPEASGYAHCTYCSAESFVDLGGAILHQVIRAAVPRSRVTGLIQAAALQAGWARATVTRLELLFEPIWEIESPDGRRLRISARPGPQGRFEQVALPGGAREYVDRRQAEAAAQWIDPGLAPESVAEVAARVTGQPVAVKTLRLIHRPVYAGRVQVGQQIHPFRLDAASGELHDLDWPARPSFRIRNRAWLATAIMAAAAALLPLPWAALAVLAAGVLAALTLSRLSALPGGGGAR
jgi:uncharacterized protein (DUF697 family)